MFDIDLVYLWVNGNDPAWKAKRNKCIGATSDDSGVNCEGRYADNDELRYSLRSINQYAPWLRKIFIVTDNQVPDWLDTSNPKIQIVDHTQIMPPECLPCFNSVVIEHHLHNIPGLSEHFIYANDDMYLNQPVTPATFFAPDGLPYIRFNRRPLRKLIMYIQEKFLHKKFNNYRLTIHNAATLVDKKYGKYYGGKTHHNIDSYLKSDYKHVRDVFPQIDETLCNHVRSDNDIQRNIYSYVPLAEKRAHVTYVNQHTSQRLHINNHNHFSKFRKFNPVFFCINDSQYATDDDRVFAKEFLKNLFPDPSPFEKVATK